MRYVDCTLTIKDMENVSIEYVDGNKTRQRDGKLAPDPLDMLTVQCMNYWINYGLHIQEKMELLWLATDSSLVERTNPTRLEDLKLIGLILYKILFHDQGIKDGFQTAQQDFLKQLQEDTESSISDLRMRLKLVIERPADEKLGSLPWEFLYIPDEGSDISSGEFLVAKQTELLLARYVPKPPMMSQFIAKQEQLRILLVITNPTGMGAIEDQGITNLKSKIKGIKHSRVTEVNNLTYQELYDMMNLDEIDYADHKSLYERLSPAAGTGMPIDNPPYHILHFIGHGETNGLYLIKDPNDYDYDARAGEFPRQLYSALEFRKIFSNTKRKPRMIFLHACKGAAQNSQEGIKSIARDLIYADIPAVVAMQYSISDKDAELFAQTFYSELGKGNSIDEAVKEGRRKLGNVSPAWKHPRFGTPVVYLQSDIANEIVKPPEPEKKPEELLPEKGSQPVEAPQMAGAAGFESPTQISGAVTAKPWVTKASGTGN